MEQVKGNRPHRVTPARELLMKYNIKRLHETKIQCNPNVYCEGLVKWGQVSEFKLIMKQDI